MTSVSIGCLPTACSLHATSVSKNGVFMRESYIPAAATLTATVTPSFSACIVLELHEKKCEMM